MLPHCVVPGAVALTPERSTTPTLKNERDYHQGMAESRFAVTAQRAEWDWLRHYVIAAIGCVPFFVASGKSVNQRSLRAQQDQLSGIQFAGRVGAENHFDIGWRIH